MTETSNKIRNTWRAVLIVGILLLSGPVWGVLATFLGTLHAVSVSSTSATPSATALASDINSTLTSALIGAVAGLSGLILVIVSSIKLLSRKPDSHDIPD